MVNFQMKISWCSENAPRQTGEVSAILLNPPLGSRLRMGELYQLAVASFTRNGHTKHVEKLTMDPHNRVLVCGSLNPLDIHRVHEKAKNARAVALVVCTRPRISLPEVMPLFLVNRDMTGMMSSINLASVKFAVSEYPSTGVSERIKTVKSKATYADKVRQGTPMSPYSNSSRSVYMEKSPDDEDVDCDSNGRGGEGWFVASFRTVKSAVTSAVTSVLTGKEPLFTVLQESTPQSLVHEFAKMRKRILAMIKSQDKSTPGKLLADATDFLEKSKVSLCHIAIAALISNQFCHSASTERLDATIFRAIGSFEKYSELRSLNKSTAGNVLNANREALVDSICYFLKRVPAIGIGGNEDSVLINTLLILDSCQVDPRPFPVQMWTTLRKWIDPVVFDRQKKVLEAHFADDALIVKTLTLCFRRDFLDFVRLARETFEFFSEEKDQKRFLCDVFSAIVDEALAGAEEEVETLSFLWDLCLSLFRTSFFPRDILASTVTRFLYKAACFDSFETMARLVCSVTVDSPERQIINQCLVLHLKSELDGKRRSVKWERLKCLFEIPRVADILWAQKLRYTTFCFLDFVMKEWVSLDEKFCLLDLLWQTKGTTPIYKETDFIRHVKAALVPRENDSECAAFLKYCSIASARPSLFVQPKDKVQLYQIVSGLVVTDECVTAMMRSPESLQSLVQVEVAGVTPMAFDSVIEETRQKITKRCLAIEQASHFLGRVQQSGTVPAFLGKISIEAFVKAFRRWAPKHLDIIGPAQKEIIDVLFSRHTLEEAQLESCRATVRKAFTSSLHNYQRNAVSRHDLIQMVQVSESQVWFHLEQQSGFIFPESSDIKIKLDSISTTLDKIREALSIPAGGEVVFLSKILAEYNCEDARLVALVNRYACFFEEGTASDSTNLLLCDMLKDESDLCACVEGCLEELEVCAYFLVKRSLLFRDKLLSEGGRFLDVKSLCDSIEGALGWLRTVIGPSSTFAGVLSAQEMTSALSHGIITEAESIMGCSALEVTSGDIANFQTMVALTEAFDPVRRFVACCEQFKFSVILDDSFSELKKAIDCFYEAKPEELSVDDSLVFVSSICSLCVKTPGIGVSLEDQLRSLTRLLRIFVCFSQYPDVWRYAEEMEWMGEDGRKLFNDQFANVTNVLLGDSESYEMSLLDSLDPVIRLVSALGIVCLEQSSVADLFAACVANKDIGGSLAENVEIGIRQVHSKLSEIKDWFSNGVDEVAATHALFSACTQSGKYSLRHSCEGDSKSLVLTLDFVVDDGTSKTSKRFQGAELEQFINGLSLIQDENIETSEKMQGFVDQYQVLSRASRLWLEMLAHGFQGARLSVFVCGAGVVYADDADSLLKKSESLTRRFMSWLHETRELYKESLLFWSEELCAVHDLIRDVALSHQSPMTLVQYISRLGHVSEMNGQLPNLSIEKCACEAYDRLEQGQASWLVEVSRFLSNACAEISQSGIRSPGTSARSEIVVHSYYSDTVREAELKLLILRSIFKVCRRRCCLI